MRYNPDADDAPRLVAAGEGHLARLIIERAQQHGVPVFKDARLATDLMRLDTGAEIPAKIYYAVAKVLAFIYALDQHTGESSDTERQQPTGDT